MEIENEPPLQVFYHADRLGSLKEHQDIVLKANGLSAFGSVYWPAFQSKHVHEMNNAERREFYLEEIRKEERYSLYASRLKSIFAANSLAEAIIFANSIDPRPNHPIPIIEIFSNKFWSLDSNWLDFLAGERTIDNFRNYWDGIITNHRPINGERRPPRIEVMIQLPARTGRIVHVVEPS